MSEPITRNEHDVAPSYPKLPTANEVHSHIHDERITASGGSSISSVKTFINSNKDMLLGILLGLVIILGLMLFFEYRHKAVSSDLATYNAQEARIQQEINKQLLVILNCRKPQ